VDISNVCFVIDNVTEISCVKGPVQTKWSNGSSDAYFEIERLKKGEGVLVEIAV